jgi:hypothetical protein
MEAGILFLTHADAVGEVNHPNPAFSEAAHDLLEKEVETFDGTEHAECGLVGRMGEGTRGNPRKQAVVAHDSEHIETPAVSKG